MIEDLLTEIYGRGWYVYSLRDTFDGRAAHWECSLRHPSAFIAYGQGPELYLALSAAIDRMDSAIPHDLPKVEIAADLPKIDLRKILNLNQKPFRKRV